MDWVATLGAAAITGLLALAGTALQHASPRELRRARQLSLELEKMEPDSPASRLVAAARDELVTAAAIRTIGTPVPRARGIALALIGASFALAAIALVPLISGLVATATGAPDDDAALLTVMLTGGSATFLLAALIPARRADRALARSKAELRDAWDLPDELRMR